MVKLLSRTYYSFHIYIEQFYPKLFIKQPSPRQAADFIPRGTGMIASSSTFRPHLGRVIRDLFRLLDAVYGIVRKH